MSKKAIAKKRRDKVKELNQYYYNRICNQDGVDKGIKPQWEMVNTTWVARNISIIKNNSHIFGDEEVEWILNHIPNIKCLYLRNVREITKRVGEMTGLISLYISGKDVDHIPNEISNLVNLETLDIGETSISELPKTIGNLKKLKNLDIHRTSITEIPLCISELESLVHLDLRELELARIPLFLIKLNLPFIFQSELWRLDRGINLFNTELKEQEITIFQRDREFIIEYIRNCNQKLSEEKVIFLGNGNVGKTYIIDRIFNDNNRLSDSHQTNTTDGIRILSKEFNVGLLDKIKLKFWDFGGEQLAHSMHKCFLTSRTVYILVLCGREEQLYSNIYYWMRMINSLKYKNRVIVVINKADEFNYGEVNLNGLKEQFPNIEKVFYMSAMKDSDESFGRFTDYLISLAQMQVMKYQMEFPQKWFPIKEHLENMAQDYITGVEFNSICDIYDNSMNEQNRKSLLEWFNDLGVVFNFAENEYLNQISFVLNGYRILKPTWLTNAVYAIIFSANMEKSFNNGLISFKKICEILIEDKKAINKKIKYKENEVPYILSVMRKFQISYKISDEYEFIPSICTKREPDES